MNRMHTLALAATLAFAALAAPSISVAQSTYDDEEQLIAQIQADKRAVVLKAMQLPDADVEKFTPIYDKYQADRKKLMERGADLLNKYASNYGSMTDDAAKGLLKDWLKLRGDDNALTEKYAKQVERALSATYALRFVQIENKLNTLIQAETQSAIPLVK